MKKILSIMLALSFAVQPAYLVAQQPVQPKKKGLIAAIKRGSAILKNNMVCFTTGKGKNCSPDKRGALRVVSDFVKGKTQAARSGLAKIIKKHTQCWVPILAMLVAVGITTVPQLESFFTGEMDNSIFAGVTAGILIIPAEFVVLSLAQEIPSGGMIDRALTRAFKWDRIKQCMLVIGLELPIVIALSLILVRMIKKHAMSKERIDVPRTFTGVGHDTEKKYTLLHAAVISGKLDRVKELIEKRADINVKDQDGNTPLHLALKKNRAKVIDLLLDSNADVKTQDNEGNSLIHTVVREGWPGERITVLMDKGADINLQNNAGEAPLHTAVLLKRQHAIDLINKKALLDIQDKEGNTPLHLIAQEGLHVSWVKRFIKEGVKLNLQNNEGNTPLHIAAQKGNEAIMQELMSAGADPNIASKKGNTPLHIAAQKGNKAIVELLMKHGARAVLKNKDGQTPAEMTTDPNIQALVRIEWSGIGR